LCGKGGFGDGVGYAVKVRVDLV